MCPVFRNDGEEILTFFCAAFFQVLFTYQDHFAFYFCLLQQCSTFSKILSGVHEVKIIRQPVLKANIILKSFQTVVRSDRKCVRFNF